MFCIIGVEAQGPGTTHLHHVEFLPEELLVPPLPVLLTAIKPDAQGQAQSLIEGWTTCKSDDVFGCLHRNFDKTTHIDKLGGPILPFIFIYRNRELLEADGIIPFVRQHKRWWKFKKDET